jgi:hypothetical protein
MSLSSPPRSLEEIRVRSADEDQARDPPSPEVGRDRALGECRAPRCVEGKRVVLEQALPLRAGELDVPGSLESTHERLAAHPFARRGERLADGAGDRSVGPG